MSEEQFHVETIAREGNQDEEDEEERDTVGEMTPRGTPSLELQSPRPGSPLLGSRIPERRLGKEGTTESGDSLSGRVKLPPIVESEHSRPDLRNNQDDEAENDDDDDSAREDLTATAASLRDIDAHIQDKDYGKAITVRFKDVGERPTSLAHQSEDGESGARQDDTHDSREDPPEGGLTDVSRYTQTDFATPVEPSPDLSPPTGRTGEFAPIIIPSPVSDVQISARSSRQSGHDDDEDDTDGQTKTTAVLDQHPIDEDTEVSQPISVIVTNALPVSAAATSGELSDPAISSSRDRGWIPSRGQGPSTPPTSRSDFAALVTGQRLGTSGRQPGFGMSSTGVHDPGGDLQELPCPVSSNETNNEDNMPPDCQEHRLQGGKRLDGMGPLPPIQEATPRINKGTSIRNGGRIYDTHLSLSLPNITPSIISPRDPQKSLSSRAFREPVRRFEKFSYSMVMYPDLKPAPSISTQPLAPIKRKDILARQERLLKDGHDANTNSALTIHNTTDRSVAYYQQDGAVIVDNRVCLQLLGRGDCHCQRCNAKRDIVKRLTKQRVHRLKDKRINAR